MKRVLVLLIAALMLFTAVSAFADGGMSVAYTGETVHAEGLGVGDTFYYTVSVTENSCLFAGWWLMEYPAEWLTPTAFSSTWSGGIIHQINQTINDDNVTSDMPEFAYRLIYEGMTGNNPKGEAGKWYTNVGMALTTFSHGGLQAGGRMFRIRYRIEKLPPANLAGHDSQGYYISLPITVIESEYWVPGTSQHVEHENITVTDGKVYTAVGESEFSVVFYDYFGDVLSTQYVENGGAATAPDIAGIVNDGGKRVFCGWDGAFDCVTSDLEIRPLYALLGDVDMNGSVDINDALMLMRASMNLHSLTHAQTVAADVSLDGTADINDALVLMRYCMGIVTQI